MNTRTRTWHSAGTNSLLKVWLIALPASPDYCSYTTHSTSTQLGWLFVLHLLQFSILQSLLRQMTAFQSPTRLFLYKIIPIQTLFGIAVIFAKAGWRGTVKIQGGMASRRNKGHQVLPPLEPAGIPPKGCWTMENCNHLSVFMRIWMYKSNPEVQEGSLKQGRNKTAP